MSLRTNVSQRTVTIIEMAIPDLQAEGHCTLRKNFVRDWTLIFRVCDV